MFKTKKKLLVLLIAAMIIIPMSVYGQSSKSEPCQGKGPCQCEQGPKPMIPDLTDKQKEQLKDLRVEHMKEIQPIMNEIGELKAKLQTLQTAESPNMNEIYKLIEAIGQQHTEIMKLKAAHVQEMRKLLTAEQRVFFDTHHPEDGGPMMQHHDMQMQKKHH